MYFNFNISIYFPLAVLYKMNADNWIWKSISCYLIIFVFMKPIKGNCCSVSTEDCAKMIPCCNVQHYSIKKKKIKNEHKLFCSTSIFAIFLSRDKNLVCSFVEWKLYDRNSIDMCYTDMESVHVSTPPIKMCIVIWRHWDHWDRQTIINMLVVTTFALYVEIPIDRIIKIYSNAVTC